MLVHGEHEAVLFGELDESGAGGDVRGKRLLGQHVLTGNEGCLDNGLLLVCRHRHVDDVYVAVIQQGLQVGIDPLDAVPASHLGGPILIDVGDPAHRQPPGSVRG